MNKNRLKSEIITAFGTQKAFAAALDWSANKVSKILTGKYIPDIEEAALIANKLNMTNETYCMVFIAP